MKTILVKLYDSLMTWAETLNEYRKQSYPKYW
jgi:hypothetical protein